MTHASLEHVFAKNAILLQMMCELLSEEKLRMAAADCLLALVERRRVWFFTALYAIYCCSYNTSDAELKRTEDLTPYLYLSPVSKLFKRTTNSQYSYNFRKYQSARNGMSSFLTITP